MVLLADIGGTKTRIATTEDLESFSDPLIFQTKKNYDEQIIEIKDKLGMLTDKPIESMIAGTTGILSKDKSKIAISPHLPNWQGRDFQLDLNLKLGIDKVYLQNDTAIVGLGEATHGLGKDYNIVSYVTISTGVGGVKIENKRIDITTFGFEPGHQLLRMGEDIKSFEELVSGSGIKNSTGLDPIDIEDKDFWMEVERNIALGLHNMILHWSPEIIILGGGIALSGKISIENIKKDLTELLTVFPEIPEIKLSNLGDLGGLYGGMEYLREST